MVFCSNMYVDNRTNPIEYQGHGSQSQQVFGVFLCPQCTGYPQAVLCLEQGLMISLSFCDSRRGRYLLMRTVCCLWRRRRRLLSTSLKSSLRSVTKCHCQCLDWGGTRGTASPTSGRPGVGILILMKLTPALKDRERALKKVGQNAGDEKE